MKALYWMVVSEAGMFRSGLHGWVQEEERAYRWDKAEQAQKYVELHSLDQQKKLSVVGVYPGDELNELWYQ